MECFLKLWSAGASNQDINDRDWRVHWLRHPSILMVFIGIFYLSFSSDCHLLTI